MLTTLPMSLDCVGTDSSLGKGVLLMVRDQGLIITETEVSKQEYYSKSLGWHMPPSSTSLFPHLDLISKYFGIVIILLCLEYVS